MFHEPANFPTIITTSNTNPPEKGIPSNLFDDALSTVKRSRASQVSEHAANLAQDKFKGARGKAGNTVQDARRRGSQELEDEAQNIAGVCTGLKLAVLDGAEVKGIEFAGSSVATEQDRVRKVHAEDGVHFVDQAVSLDAVDVALGDGLVAAVVPRAVFVLVGTEEGRDGFDIGDVVLLAVGVELRQECSVSVQKKSGRSEEEVGVLFVLCTMLVLFQSRRCSMFVQIGATFGSGSGKDRRC